MPHPHPPTGTTPTGPRRADVRARAWRGRFGAVAPRRTAPLLAGLLAAGVVGVLVAVLPGGSPAPEGTPAADPAAAVADPTAPAAALPAPPAGPACAPLVAGLTPRERLAQRLMVGVDAGDPAGTAELVRATQVGGIFLGGNATALLRDGALERVQQAARLPVTVAVDDEGGRVQRIDDLDGDLPSARRMAATGTPEQVRALGRGRGELLAARGVTMDLAPTVDLGGQPRTAVIGDRAFATDPADVARYAGAFADGLRDAGVAAVLKHFPGHGRADGDSHRGRVTTPPLDALKAADLRPYAELLRAAGAGAPTGVMVGHLDVPGLTDGLPTSLTPATYALLRDELGFDGLVLTDDLGAMKAVTGRFALSEAVARALDAGADVALWSSGGRPEPVLAVLEQALAAGELDAAANDRAVARVLAAKGLCAA
ncbi:MAG: glycoside hydrolase family 3 N-terminal domain-containing protein [Pseudonocardia sp.]